MHLLPPNATPQERAMSLTTARLLEVPVSPVKSLWSPWDCPAAVLPWLSWSLSVSPWKSEWDERTKRAAIAAAVETHRIRGTIGAVKRALETLGFDVEIDEKTGQAYTFRILLESEGRGYTNADQTPRMNADAADCEEATLREKNARSSLLGVYFFVGRGGVATCRAALMEGQTTFVRHYTQTTFEFTAPLFAAIGQKLTVQIS